MFKELGKFNESIEYYEKLINYYKKYYKNSNINMYIRIAKIYEVIGDMLINCNL